MNIEFKKFVADIFMEKYLITDPINHILWAKEHINFVFPIIQITSLVACAILTVVIFFSFKNKNDKRKLIQGLFALVLFFPGILGINLFLYISLIFGNLGYVAANVFWKDLAVTKDYYALSTACFIYLFGTLIVFFIYRKEKN